MSAHARNLAALSRRTRSEWDADERYNEAIRRSDARWLTALGIAFAAVGKLAEDYAPVCLWCHGERFFDRDGFPDVFGSVRCDAEGCFDGRTEWYPTTAEALNVLDMTEAEFAAMKGRG